MATCQRHSGTMQLWPISEMAYLDGGQVVEEEDPRQVVACHHIGRLEVLRDGVLVGGDGAVGSGGVDGGNHLPARQLLSPDRGLFGVRRWVKACICFDSKLPQPEVKQQLQLAVGGEGPVWQLRLADTQGRACTASCREVSNDASSTEPFHAQAVRS